MSVTERGREGEEEVRESNTCNGFKFFYKVQKIYKACILISCLSVIFIFLHLMRRK